MKNSIKTESHPRSRARLRLGPLKSNFLAAAVALTTYVSFDARAVTILEGEPDGKLADAPSVRDMFAVHNRGCLFRVEFIPTPDRSGKHVFNLPESTTYCQFTYAHANVVIKRGDIFVVTDVKHIHKYAEGLKVAVPMVELKKLVNGNISDAKEDRIVYKGTFVLLEDVPAYNEEYFVRGLTMWFVSLAEEARDRSAQK